MRCVCAGDTLFSAGFPLTPTSIPPSSPQTLFSTAGLSPAGLVGSLEADRGISQLELMARGFSTMPHQMPQQQPQQQQGRRMDEENKRSEPKRGARGGGKERRQSRTDRRSKEDAVRVNSCGCPVSQATCTVTSVNAAQPINLITTSE
jgi:hypothetical protein